MAKTHPRRNISRIENVTTAGNLSCGWEVRIQRRGKTVEKFFCDSLLKGSRNALKKAKEFRDKMESEMRGYTVKELAKRPSIRNKSGIVGVRFEERISVTGGNKYYYPTWVAQWTDADGKRRTKAFSCEKYGKEVAKKKAISARRRGVNAANRSV